MAGELVDFDGRPRSAGMAEQMGSEMAQLEWWIFRRKSF